jgi:hypothetical protein
MATKNRYFLKFNKLLPLTQIQYLLPNSENIQAWKACKP